MQTKPKQKLTAILIAFTMILTTMIQLCIPITVHAEETSHTVQINIGYQYGYNDDESSQFDIYSHYTFKSDGFIKMITYVYEGKSSGNNYNQYIYTPYIISDKPIYQTYRITKDPSGENIESDEKLFTTTKRNGYYWSPLYGLITTDTKMNGTYYVNTSGLVNINNLTENNAQTVFFEYLDKGNIDLSKDDYEEKTFDEDNASYSLDLDLASLGAKSNSAWNIEKTESGLTLTTPSTAGVNIYWKTKQNIENSYMKIIFNGKYYKKLLDIKYVNGAISLQGEGASSSVTYNNIDRSANEKFFLFKDILSDCISQNGYEGGYSFVIDNITIQCFAEIEGELKRSRIYKIDFNMLRENGSTDTVFNNPSDVTYSTIDSTIGDYTTSNDDMSFIADIDVDKPIYEYDEIDTNTYTNFFKWFYDMLQSISKSLGQFPDLISTVFKFLPNEFVVILGLTIGVVVILRFLGR